MTHCPYCEKIANPARLAVSFRGYRCVHCGKISGLSDGRHLFGLFATAGGIALGRYVTGVNFWLLLFGWLVTVALLQFLVLRLEPKL